MKVSNKRRSPAYTNDELFELTTHFHDDVKMVLSQTFRKDVQDFTHTPVQFDREIDGWFRKALGESRIRVNWNGSV